ncbi:MAG: hypothetical protein AB1772_11555 [Candidatus Zixiibacteriota bacterium]
MMKKALLALSVAVLWSVALSMSAWSAVDTKADRIDAERLDKISAFNVGVFPMESRSAYAGDGGTYPGSRTALGRRPVGSAQSPNVGIGPGVSIDLTWHDEQYTWGSGRQINHWWNGQTGETAEVSVHFAYMDRPDEDTARPYVFTGYNMYDAIVPTGNWPRDQDVGCDIQATDTIGAASRVSMDIMFNGRAVLGSMARFFRNLNDTTRLFDNNIYYQGAEFNCTFDPRSNLNVTWVDSTVYRPRFMDQSAGNYARDPQVVTQWDGTNTIVHLLLGSAADDIDLSGNDYVPGLGYRAWTYFRKVGDAAETGTWSSGQTIDSIWFVWTELAAAPYPHTGVAVVYTNPSYYGALLNNGDDIDVWARESFDRGLSWQPAYSVTNYTNAIANHPNHFTAWLEAGCMFDSEGDLHVYWAGKPTSTDPYFDGFNWQDFDENVYHWEKTNDQVVPGVGDAVKVANGNFMNDDMLTGSMNTLHCGFGGSNVGYLGWITMGECDSKLYLVWGQIHERANRFPWRDVATQPAPGVLDDCSYTGERLAMANWELLMSVAQLSTSTLWDAARNISNTYTPDCGLVGDPEANGPCGSEWKPSIERYALDESGLDLTWPAAAEVDLSPGGNYAGGWYLNMEYMDDQFPGPWFWSTRVNPPGTENSEKWVRLACVEPIEASQIDVIPERIEWPEWVPLGQATNFTITVVNEGNVTLNVTEVGDNASWLTSSINPSPGSPFQVPAGVIRTATFQASITAPAGPTQWLDGEMWLKSDAANIDSFPVRIHVLAATDVEDVAWDTVKTHEYMFDEFFEPEGEVVALGVGNNGDLGWGAGSSGGINLDYYESGLECGPRVRDRFYLIGSSAYTILASASDGTGAELSQVFNDANQADETGFDPSPAKGSITGGLAAGGGYDSVYTGQFVNRDTTVAFERTVYGPRSATPATANLDFVVLLTKAYSGDGQAHSHVTIGNVVDWDIPADSVPYNTSDVSIPGGFVYVQGTDTTGHTACQSHANRFATEAFGGSYTTNPCASDPDDYHSFNVLIQTLMVDTTHYRDGTPLVPSQPNPLVWWQETTPSGLNADVSRQDQAVWFTYKHDYTLGATDTLYYWTVLSTVRNGSLTDLENQVSYARSWFKQTVQGCGGCCVGRVGDANNSGEDEPTIGDVTVMIDAKFISGTCDGIIACLTEADINQSGGAGATCEDISIGDITILIDYLFITGQSLGLPNCL